MINDKNYFEFNNKALTNSKLNDFRKDKKYFFDKHILGLIVKGKTDALIIGSAVDCWLTEGKEVFDKKYYAVARRKKEDTDYEYQLNDTLFEEITKICTRVQEQRAYQQLADYQKQQIIQVPMDLGEHFNCLCGKPDWFKIKDGVCTITDLKTSATVDGKKYHWHCEDFGYYRQAAMYRYILSLLYPEIKEFFHFHLVVEKDPDDIYNCTTFQLEEETIQEELKELMFTLEEVKNEKDFNSKNVGFEDAILVGRHINDR